MVGQLLVTIGRLVKKSMKSPNHSYFLVRRSAYIAQHMLLWLETLRAGPGRLHQLVGWL